MKARREPDEQAAEAPEAEEPSGKTKKLTYTGPAGQVVTGLPELITGEEYDVPVEIADSLVAGSVFWE